MMFNNCGNLGLPLAVLAFGDKALEAAIVLFLISNVGHFTLGVYLFGGVVSWKGLATTPVNIATVIALIFNFTGMNIPQFILFPISMVGQIVIPLMLFSLGVRMINVRMEHWKAGIIGAVVCPVSGLLFAGLAVLVYFSGQCQMADGAVGDHAIAIALAKTKLTFVEAFVRGILCNILVCLAVWLNILLFSYESNWP